MMRAFPRNIINLSKEDFLIVKKAIKNNRIMVGPDIKEFENLFATYIGTRHAIAVSSARAGLVLVLKALNLQRGDEVILPAYTFHMIPAIIKSMGLKPVFIDVRIDTYNIDTSLIEEKITSRTKLILATHILGQPCEIDKIMDLSKRYNIKVIEDCAHSCGAEYETKKVGSFSEAGIFSFGIGKILNCFGGGIITCSDDKFRDKLLYLLKDYSDFPKQDLGKDIFKCALFYLFTHHKIFPYSGYLILRVLDLFGSHKSNNIINEPIKLYKQFPSNYYKKFTNLQAMVGIHQLNYLDDKINAIIKNAEIYDNELGGLRDLAIPYVASKAKHVYLYYHILVKNREELRRRLLKNGIDTKIDDIAVCPELGIFSESGTKYQIAKEISMTSLDLPCYYNLSDKDVYRIAAILRKELYKP